MKFHARAALAAAFLFVSGLCALIYQTVWLREFRLVFGASTAASAAVLGIFMAGLGIGSAWLGRRMERVPRPLAWYGGLELGIAAAAALTPALLWLVRHAYVATGGSSALGHGPATLVRLGLAAVVLLGPTILMGGTLPAMARAATRRSDDGRRTLALLYGSNTMGAVAGALLSTFWLVEAMGNRGALWTACTLNAVVALTATLVARTDPASDSDDAETSSASEPVREAEASPRFVLLASALVGFAFMLMELVWYRMLAPILGGSSFTFGLILAVALFGIGLGGWLYSWRQMRAPTLSLFGWTCALEACALALPFALGDRIALLALELRGLGGLGFGGQALGWTLVTVVVILPAGLVAGFQFPLLIALLGSGRSEVARHTGQAYAANTAGAILGSLAGGFGLMPLLTAPGLWRAMIALLALLALAPWCAAGRQRRLAFAPVLALAMLAGLLAFLPEGPTAAWRHGGIGAGRATPESQTINGLQEWVNKTRRSIPWEAEGVESSVALGMENGYSFIINGKVDGHIRGDAGTQVMGGLLPCLLRPARQALVIGLGTGCTAGWLGATPQIERVDVVELEPAVLEIARRCAPANAHVLENPKVQLSFGDAREALLTGARQYDLIFSEPSNPYRAGIASLFTQEFYRAVSGRLSAHGIFAQWVQSYEVDGRAMHAVYATLGRVFEQVETWQTQSGDFLLLATHEPLPLDSAELRARLATEPYRSALLNTWGVDTLEGVLAHHTADDRLCRAVLAGGTQPCTDDRNDLEFGFARQVGAKNGPRGLGAEIGELAAHQGWQQVALAGEVNEQAVDREREVFFPGSTTDWAARVALPGRDGAVWAALRAGQAPSGKVFAETWHTHPFEPESYSERWLLAMNLAGAGDPDCWRFLAQVSSQRPGDAEAIYARAFCVLGREDEAIPHLIRALETWRGDPWPALQLSKLTLEKCGEIASRANPAIARTLYAALRTPLCVRLNEQVRLNSAFQAAVAASSPADESRLQEAIAAFGPHRPWQKPMLEQRAALLSRTHAPEEPAAAADWRRFLAAEVEPFAHGLKAPPALPTAPATPVQTAHR